MNAGSEMTIWLALSAILCFQLQIPGNRALTTVYRPSSSGRKLFGGYRIVPKTCTGVGDGKRSSPGKGICMFNYECTRRGGQTIGSCVDGFLFGACCSLGTHSGAHPQHDADSTTPLREEPDRFSSSRPASNFYNGYGSSTTQRHPSTVTHAGVTETSSSNAGTHILSNMLAGTEDPDDLFSTFLFGDGQQQQYTGQPLGAKPLLEQYLNNENHGGFIDNQGFLPVHKYPIADTVLLNPDGSLVGDDETDPELLFTRPSSQKIGAASWSAGKPGSKPPETTNLQASVPSFSPGGYGVGGNTGLPFGGLYVPHAGVGPQRVTEQPPVTAPKTPAPTEMRKTTKFGASFPVTPAPGGYTSSDGNLILVHTLSQSNGTAKPTPSTSKASTKYAYATSRPKPTASTVEIDDRYPGFHYETYTGASKPPVVVTGPIGFDGSGQAINHILGILDATRVKPVQHTTVSVHGDPALSTWVTIGGGGNTGSTELPSTATEYVHGPGFTVHENDGNKPVPTVIVIGPPSTDSSHVRPKPTDSPIVHRPTSKPIRITARPQATGSTTPFRPATTDQPQILHLLPSGEESLVNFPPVRNPDLDLSSSNQVEKPTIVHSGGYPLPDGLVHGIDIAPDEADLDSLDPDEDYSDMTTPAMEDDKVNVKIHNFVEKIVNSLAGNFQDLEGVLFRNENKTKLPNQNGIELTDVHLGLVHPDDSGSSTNRPRPSIAGEKPVKKPLPATLSTQAHEAVTNFPATLLYPSPSFSSSVTSEKPLILIGSTKLTTTRKPIRRPTTSASVTTRRPPSVSFSTDKPSSATTRRPTTKRPRPSTAASTTTTKRPRPSTTTKRTATTTAVPPQVVTDEESEQPATTDASDATDHSTVDFRKECGVRPMVKKNGRIVGGKGSQFGHYPWQVLVRESTWLGLFTKNKCGGVLITHKYVITAAHCQPGFLASLVAVFGEFDISGELESRRSVAKNVRRVIVHRQYDPATFENDLALLELDSPIAYDEHIVPICMPRDGEDYTGRMATVTGWGRLKYGGGVPSVLQEVRVPLIDNAVCQEMFQTAGHNKRIISSFLCAGYANGQKDSCEGDSGGPLMVEREDGHWVLLGTVSHGIKCAAPYLPGVYMRTTYYKPWLKSITGVTA